MFMMNRRNWGVVLAFSFSTSLMAQDIELIPASADGLHTISGREIILETPGQRVFFEIGISGWDPNLSGTPRIKAYQVTIDSSSYASGLKGVLLPANQPCSSSSECRDFFGFGSSCTVPSGVGTICSQGYIDGFRLDYIFSLFSDLRAVDISTLNYRYGATLLSDELLVDIGQKHYGGTLVIDVPSDAMGTFTIALNPEDSELTDENNSSIPAVVYSPAILTIKCQSNVDCDDSNSCTSDTCQANGICQNTLNFNPITECCNPADGTTTTINDFIQCTEDSCDATTGLVSHNPLTPGTPCGSAMNTVCDGEDTCDSEGICQSNLASLGASCGDPTNTDCNLADTCDGNGSCDSNFVAPNTLCNDDSLTTCSAPDTCDGLGTCLTNHSVDGLSCNDGLFCNENESCLNGLCSGGLAVDCADALTCTTDTCNEDFDQCDNLLNAGSCLILGICVDEGGLNPDNDCESCDTLTTSSDWSLREAGALCSDGDACTGTGRPGIGVDECDGLGICLGTLDPECNDDCDFAVVASEGITVGNNDNRGLDDVEASCQIDSNNDVWFIYSASCNGQVFISTTGSQFVPSNDPVLSIYDACPGAGGLEIACDDDSGIDLQAALFFNATSGTSYWIRIAGFEDNTGDIVLNINPIDDCFIDGLCHAVGTLNPANDCEACIPTITSMDWSFLAEGIACGSDLDTECDSPDACNGTGLCEFNPKPDDTECSDDGNDCTFDICRSGSCTHPPQPIETPCGSPLSTVCNNLDTCDGNSLCRDNFVTLGTSCGDQSVDQCNDADICDGLGDCDINLKDLGTPCDDGDICTGSDICDTGLCAGTPIAQAPLVEKDSSAYLAVTPLPAGLVPPIALRLTSPDWTCIDRYINLLGRLVDSPVFHTPDEWGRVLVLDKVIVPNSLYTVEAICGDFTSDPGTARTAIFGDVAGFFDVDLQTWDPPDGSVDVISDFPAIVEAFQHLPTAPPLERTDIAPCKHDRKIDILDITWVVDAFKSLPYPCANPCP